MRADECVKGGGGRVVNKVEHVSRKAEGKYRWLGGTGKAGKVGEGQGGG